MIIALIVAVAKNGVIGAKGKLPWHLPADLKHFKRLTMGHSLIVGRKTYEAIGRPLPGRRMIVISRRQKHSRDGVIVAPSLETALSHCHEEERVFVGGGAQIYSLALPLAMELFLTRIDCTVDGDARFPSIDEDEWKKVSEEGHEPDQANPYAYSFLYYKRTSDLSDH